MAAIDHVRGCLPGIFSTAHLLGTPSVANRALVAWAGLYRLGAPDAQLSVLIKENKERILAALEGHKPLEGWARYGIIPEYEGQEEGNSNSFELLRKVDNAQLLAWAVKKMGGAPDPATEPAIKAASLVVRGAPHLFVDAYWWASMVIAGACPRILEEEPELADSIGLLFRVVEWVDLHPQK